MIYAFNLANVMTVEHDFALELGHLLNNLLMLNHNHNKIRIAEKSVEIVVLIYNNIFGDKWIIALQGDCQMPFLSFQELECRTFATVIYIFLVRKAI